MVFRRKLIIARKMRGGGASPEKLDPSVQVEIDRFGYFLLQNPFI